MEQGLSFIVVVTLCNLAIFVLNSPIIFLITFLLGSSYLVVRGKQKGWKLPKNIKDTHQWKS
jgi:hypothetical protein